MIPFGSGSLLFGCTNSMVLLTADPAFDNAQFKPLSNSVGLVDARAFANSTGRSLYFIGTDGMYKVDENAFSIDESNKISDGKLDAAFDQTKWDETRSNVAYDHRRQGIWIYLTRTVAPLNSVHYFYHIPSNSFWPQVFSEPNFDGPTVVAYVRPSDSQAPYVLLANDTKFCRFSEGSYFGSDGYPDPVTSLTRPSWTDFFNGYILSYIKLGPIFNPQRRRFKVRAIEVDLDIEIYNVPQLSSGVNPDEGTDVYPTPPEILAFMLSGETAEQAKGSAYRDRLIAQVIDFGELRGTSFDGVDTWEDVEGDGTILTDIDGGFLDADHGGGGRWETNETTDAALSITSTIDGNVGTGIGEYVVTNPFEEGQDREYAGPDSCVLKFASTYWRILDSDDNILYQSQETGATNPTDVSYYESPALSGLSADYRTTVAITGSPANSFSVKALGSLAPGRSNRKGVNVNAPAHYILLQALGRPLILESVGALLEDGGPNSTNTQTVVT
jgi:hypothetical protein